MNNCTVFLVATSKNIGLENCMKSLSKADFAYRVLGLGQKWGGWRHRMKLYRDAAISSKAEIIVCMDAYDALCLRNMDGLLETFRSFNKPLVLSVEPVCGGNCVSLSKWWKSKYGQPFYVERSRSMSAKNTVSTARIPKSRYVNGGLLMGYREAIVELYDWMLTDRSKIRDDQRGLGKYCLAFPDRWAPDVENKIFRNSIYGGKLSELDVSEKGAWFAHFPGMTVWSTTEYNKTTKHIFGKRNKTSSFHLGNPKQVFCSVSVIVLILMVIFLFVKFVL